MTQVVAHTATTLHQLHLFFIDAHHSTIRVCIAVESNHKTVRQRGYLVIVTDARHRTSGRYDITEMVQQVKDLLCRQRIFVLLLYAGYLISQSPMHLFW